MGIHTLFQLMSFCAICAIIGCQDAVSPDNARPSVQPDKGVVVLNPIDFGAKGNGRADDTEAFNRLDETIAKTKLPVHVYIPAGEFMVNPLKTPIREIAPGKLRRNCLMMLRSDHSKLTAAGVIKILPGVDYKRGMKNGQEWYWAVVNIKANYCTIDGLHFDGNGTGTYTGWIDTQANIRWEGVSAFGECNGKDCHTGNKVVNCTIIGGGGQAVAFQYQNQATIAYNTFQDSSGAGFSRCDESILIGNTAIRSHDAPYVVNGRCNNIIIANNISKGTTNGSGIDVVGCSNVLIQGNVIEDSAAWGLLIGYSAQQNIGGQRILIKDNLFVNNCRSIDTPMNAEICVGRPWSDTADVAKDVTIMGNQFTIDGTHGDYKGNMVSVGYGVTGLTVIHNVVAGKPNKQNAVVTVWAPAKNIYISDNIWMGRQDLKVVKKAKVQGDFKITGNRKIIP